jgi:hypothetical protein
VIYERAHRIDGMMLKGENKVLGENSAQCHFILYINPA